MTQTSGGKSMAIVVNDDATQRKVLTALLAKGGFDVRAFNGGEAALEALVAGLVPDLVVTDLCMPGIDGWQLCRLLRSPDYARFNATPILVVSAIFSGEEPARITAALGANAFLPQPVHPRELLETVAALLRNETPLRSLRVLIVDDEQSLAELLQTTFEKHGYHADIALTGRDALDAFNQGCFPEDWETDIRSLPATPRASLLTAHDLERRDPSDEAAFRPSPYDVAVLDYHLPDMEGDQLLRVFRRQCPSCAVVMMTGDQDHKLAVAWMKAGAAAYTCKPFDPNYLVELCAKACRERSLLWTEQRLEESIRELRASEAFNTALFEYNPIETIVVDREGCVVRWNRTKTLSGDALPTVGARMYVDYADRHEMDMRAALMDCIETGKTREFPEQRYADKVLSIKISPFPAEDSHGAVITMQDITDRKALEARLRHAQKLQSIATLASGVAHEINNPINGIMNYAQLMKDRTEGNDPVLESFADEIIHESERVAMIVKHLRSFASGETTLRAPLTVSAVLESAFALLRTLLTRNQIAIVTDVPADLPELMCNAGQIQQVLVNLISNASDALNDRYPEDDENKTIIITAKVRSRSGETAGSPSEIRNPKSKTDTIRITVEDHGAGIPERLRPRVFDPFFTTKDKSAGGGAIGRGLGLFMGYAIVRDHGGMLSMESEDGQWTRFHMDLPAVPADEPQAQPPPAGRSVQ